MEAWLRRSVRWARQTVEIFYGDCRSASLELKFMLCRHMLSYVNMLVCVILLFLSVLYGPRSLNDAFESYRILELYPKWNLVGLVVPFLVIWTTAILRLRFVIAASEVSLLMVFAKMMFGPILNGISLVPIAVGMVTSSLGRKTKFIPTNSVNRSEGKPHMFCYFVGTLALTATFAMLLIKHPGSLLVGFNVLGIIAIFASPVFMLRCYTMSTNESKK